MFFDLNFLVIIFAITLIYLAVAERTTTYIKLLTAQGVLLCVIALVELNHIDVAHFAFILAETVIFKALIIPYFLRRIVKRNRLTKAVETILPSYFSLIIVAAVLLISFMISTSLYESLSSGTEDQPLKIKYFTVSITAVFTGILLIMTQQRVISHLIGYIIIENGIFLLSLAIGKEMPMIINTGILMDIFISVFVLGVFVNKIGDLNKASGAHDLHELKD